MSGIPDGGPALNVEFSPNLLRRGVLHRPRLTIDLPLGWFRAFCLGDFVGQIGSVNAFCPHTRFWQSPAPTCVLYLRCIPPGHTCQQPLKTLIILSHGSPILTCIAPNYYLCSTTCLLL